MTDLEIVGSYNAVMRLARELWAGHACVEAARCKGGVQRNVRKSCRWNACSKYKPMFCPLRSCLMAVYAVLPYLLTPRVT